MTRLPRATKRGHTEGVMLAILLLSLASLGVSILSLRVAIGAARSLPKAPEPPPLPRYIGGKP